MRLLKTLGLRFGSVGLWEHARVQPGAPHLLKHVFSTKTILNHKTKTKNKKVVYSY